MKDIAIRLNGQVRRLAVNPNETLLEVLRGKLGIKTPKEGCGRGDCGACTVLLNGKAVRSCLILAVEADGQSVTTLEGVGRAGPTALQKAFIGPMPSNADSARRGVVLAASALLGREARAYRVGCAKPWRSNLCRCTGYEAMVKTVMPQPGKAIANDPPPGGVAHERQASDRNGGRARGRHGQGDGRGPIRGRYGIRPRPAACRFGGKPSRACLDPKIDTAAAEKAPALSAS